jgi:hypothetical protein
MKTINKKFSKNLELTKKIKKRKLRMKKNPMTEKILKKRTRKQINDQNASFMLI